jgi:muramoyltetrapeptide carboxypeptidase
MKPILPGMTLGVMAPSRCVAKPEIFEAGVAALKAKGFKVEVHPQTFLRWHQFAGTEQQKAAALHDLLKNPGVDAIIAAGGGNRALHLLDHIDWDTVKKNPKPVIGFSDTTALLNAFYARAGIEGFHGPTVSTLGKGVGDDSLEKALSRKPHAFEWKDAKTLHAGAAEGPLVGGNLCVLSHLLGTDFAPDLNGALLFLEDDGEDIRRIDRMFLSLRRAGKNFAGVKAVILGEFSNTTDDGTSGIPYGLSGHDLITEHFGGLGIPVVHGAPFGHGTHLPAFPVGRKARLEAGKTVRLSI